MVALLAIALGLALGLGTAVATLGYRFADRAWRDAVRLRERRLTIDERALEVEAKRAKGTTPPAAIPPDLMRRITAWRDEAAQGAERKVLLDLYAECEDAPDPWSEVRKHLPRAPDDGAPMELLA